MNKYPYAATQTADEIAGMKEAEKYFAERPGLCADMCKLIGRQVYERGKKRNEARADGFRRMAYIISQESVRND